MSRPIAWYREFAPCAALHDYVSAFFSFLPTPLLAPAGRTPRRENAFREVTFFSPQLADGNVSIVFELGRSCEADGIWHDDGLALRGTVIGPMTAVGRTEGHNRAEMVGVYFRPGRADDFLHVNLSELTDNAVEIEDVWGASGSLVPVDLRDRDEVGRIDRLEVLLLTHLARHRRRASSLDVQGLASAILRRRGRMTVDAMARAVGLSRQHLTRRFREQIGITPKLYSRLARFQSGLSYARSPGRVDWASAAAHMGYADQSHMIAEFVQFSGLTPHALASRHCFHPFIERARAFGPAF